MRLIALLALVGCSGSGTDSDIPLDGEPAPVDGTMALTFRIDTDYQAAMDEPAIGTFYGSFWRGSEVTSLGPDDGAEDLGGIEVIVDLTAENPTGVLFTSDALPIEEIVVLGFLDSDGNADVNAPDPDNRDPVTLPNDNDFDVIGGEETVVEVFLGFLNP